MLKAIIFDFGNVVGFFDHKVTLAKLAPFTSWSPERIYNEIYTGPIEDDLESGRISVDEFLHAFIQRCELRCDAAFLRSACGDIFTPNAAVCDLIPQLKTRYRIILGSNTNPLHAAHFQKQFANVLDHFHHQVLSHVIGVRKPKAAFFHECAERADAAPHECLFIDDLTANIAGAKAIGMHGLVYHPGVDVSAALQSVGHRV